MTHIDNPIQALKEGKKIRRKKWDKENYCYLEKDGARMCVWGSHMTMCNLKAYEFLEEDWELYEEPQKTIEEVPVTRADFDALVKRVEKLESKSITFGNIGI